MDFVENEPLFDEETKQSLFTRKEIKTPQGIQMRNTDSRMKVESAFDT